LMEPESSPAMPETSGSGCDSSVVFAITVVWRDHRRWQTAPQSAHRGGRMTSPEHNPRASWNQWPEFCLITHPERLGRFHHFIGHKGP
jgi:hypothetical protein